MAFIRQLLTILEMKVWLTEIYPHTNYFTDFFFFFQKKIKFHALKLSLLGFLNVRQLTCEMDKRGFRTYREMTMALSTFLESPDINTQLLWKVLL